MTRTTSETDARTDEYATCAPSGETCPDCGPPVVVYRHPECAKPYRRAR
ncbi:hypothetical protein [Streptomyces sp. NPDC004291]